MDLDKIKDKWQSAEVKTSIDENKIQQILNNKGGTALGKLIKNEKTFFKIGIASIIFLPMFWEMHITLFYMYLLLLVLGWGAQWYKIGLLKKIDLQSMSILEVSSSITKYKKYLIGELTLGFILLFVFIVMLGVTDSTNLIKDMHEGNLFAILYFISLIFIAIVFIVLTYKKAYWKNIKAIQASIKEIKSFEEENI